MSVSTDFNRRLVAVAVIMAVVLLAALSLAVRPASAAGVAYNVGDVFAAIGNGKITHFSNTGAVLDSLDSTHTGTEDDGMCFDGPGNLYSTQAFSSNTMSKFDNHGNVTAVTFGTGYNSDPESCSFNSAGQLYVGQADGAHVVRKMDSAGALLDTYPVAVEGRGSDWVDLAADQCTLFYTSEGTHVKRYNVCTKTQLADFGQASSQGACYALRIRPNGEVLVACTDRVVRMNTSGVVVQTYLASGFTPASTFLFAANLDPDGTTFWTGDYNAGDIYRINIATGAQVTHFKAAGVSPMGGLAVFGEQRAAVQASPSPSPSPVASVAPALPKAGGPEATSMTGPMVPAAVSVALLLLGAVGWVLHRRGASAGRNRS